MGELLASDRSLNDLTADVRMLDGTGWVYGGGVSLQRVGMAFHLKPGMNMLGDEDMADLQLYDEDGALNKGFSVEFSPLIDNQVIMYEGAPSESFLEFLRAAAEMNPVRTHLHITHEMLREAFTDWVVGTYPEAKTIGDVVIRQFLAPPPDQSCSIG